MDPVGKYFLAAICVVKQSNMKPQQKKRLLAVMLSALLTGAVTIMSSLLMDYLAAKKGNLSYRAQVSGTFDSDTVHLHICNLELRNDGDALLEDIKGMVQFDGQRIVAYRLQAPPALHLQDSVTASGYRLSIDFLNPAEKLAMAFLLSGRPAGQEPSLVDFRARGSSAVGSSPNTWFGRPLPTYALLLALGLVAAILSGAVFHWLAGNSEPLGSDSS